MRPRIWFMGLVTALMLMSMMGISAIGKDATPPTSAREAEIAARLPCGMSIPLFRDDALPRPKGVTVVYACGYFSDVDITKGGLAYIGTLTEVEPNLVISNSGEGENIRQTGTANITVLQGSLMVGLVATCAEKQGCGKGVGTARYTTTDVNNRVEWISLEVGAEPTTIKPGDMLILQNVTVTFSTGEEGALVSSSGSYNPGPGSGCPVRCWQFP